MSLPSTVCRHAIKANDELHQPEVEKLLRDLMDCELPYCCPHGRPTMIQIGYGDLEKEIWPEKLIQKSEAQKSEWQGSSLAMQK